MLVPFPRSPSPSRQREIRVVVVVVVQCHVIGILLSISPRDTITHSLCGAMGRNAMDWIGIDWNGVEWIGVDWNGVDRNGVDWTVEDCRNCSSARICTADRWALAAGDTRCTICRRGCVVNWAQLSMCNIILSTLKISQLPTVIFIVCHVSL